MGLRHRSAVANAPILIAVTLVLAGCGGGSTSESTSTTSGEVSSSEVDSSQEVSKFQVTERLERLAKAVVAYTDADYGEEPTSLATLNQAQSKLDVVAEERAAWNEFTSTINYETSDIPDLQSAIRGYDKGFDAWYSRQFDGLRNWQKCQEESSDDFVVAMCMLDGYSLEDEQEALDAYTVGLQNLLTVLGIS